MYKVELTTKFKKNLEKFLRKHPQYLSKIKKQLKILTDTPTQKSLRLHKLSGKDVWSISVDKSIRIIVLIRRDVFILLDIGTHDDVY